MVPQIYTSKRGRNSCKLEKSPPWFGKKSTSYVQLAGVSGSSDISHELWVWQGKKMFIFYFLFKNMFPFLEIIGINSKQIIVGKKEHLIKYIQARREDLGWGGEVVCAPLPPKKDFFECIIGL